MDARKLKVAATFLLLDNSSFSNVVNIAKKREAELSNMLAKRDVKKRKDVRDRLIESYDDEEFVRHFRMNREMFQRLLGKLIGHLPQPYDGFGEKIIPPEQRLYIVIWFLASKETYRQLACRFGTCESVVHESVDMVVNALIEELGDMIKFPETEEQCHNISKKFRRRNGFPGIVGAIDGTHISIMKPADEPDSWIDRKGNYSIAVTAVVDSDKRFIYTSIGCPGSFHDQRVYRLSDLSDNVERLPNNYHLIGDSAYTLSSHMIVPHKDNGRMTVAQRAFNYKHSCNRMVVEHAFGLLKNKFPRIHSTLQVRTWDRAVNIILACMLLHNFVIELDGEADDNNHDMEEIQLPMDKEKRRQVITGMLEQH